MAYVSGDIAVTVRGISSPSESWVNSWAFSPDGGSPNAQACVDALRTFYDDLAGTWFPTEYSAVGARITQLFTGITTDADWIVVDGAATDDIAPTQLAVRLSLRDSAGHNGGPFLAGWNKLSIAEDGLVDSGAVSAIDTALAAMDTTVLANDYHIGIHLPTTNQVVVASQARIGRRFDVIRKRGNDTAEAYLTQNLG